MKFTEEQKEAIFKRDSNILVSAGAGSGKTAVLSERVLELLKEGNSINDILVLTFTNAAASEMQDRIRRKIKDEKELASEYEKISSSYITTFDSFCYSVLKKYHYLKKLPKNINIADESILKLKKEKIIDNLFNKYYEDDNESFKNIIKMYFLKNDNTLKTFILDTYDNMNLIYNKKDFLHNFINNYFSDEYINNLTNRYENILLKKVEEIKVLMDEISYIGEDYYSKLAEFLSIKTENYDDIKVFSNFSVPRLPNGSEDDLKIIKARFNDEVKALNELCKYNTLEDLYNEYTSLKDIVIEIIDIIKEFDIEYKQYQNKEYLYDFLDIEKLAIDILMENEDVRDYYKYRFKEILIDEYQDTSDIQELFISLISNNNVYMVGDIKQSIYKFRNANPYIFKEKYDSFKNNVEGIKIDLNKNFRSSEGVINIINNIFNIIMDDEIGEANYKLEHNLVCGNKVYNELGLNKDYFNILNYEIDKESKYKKEEVEAFLIAKDIKDKLDNKTNIFDKDLKNKREVKYSDFAILMDRGKNFDLYKQIFEYLNIPLSIYRDVKINEEINIKVIKNIFNLINKVYLKEYDTSFKRSFYALGRSFLYELKDSYLYEVNQKNLYKETKIYEDIKDIAINLDEKSIYQIIKEVINKFSFYEKFIKLGNIENNNAVLEYLINTTKSLENLYDINDFINYLDLILKDKVKIEYKSNDNSEGVKLMTIHGSKGLEFPILYISGMYEKFNDRDIKERFLFNKDIGFLLPVYNENLSVLFTKEILKYNYQREDLSEKIRLFYVALTRAKEQLVLVSQITQNNYDNLLNINRKNSKSFDDLLELVINNLSKYKKQINLNELDLTKDYKLNKNMDLNQLIEKNDVINVVELNLSKELEERKTFSKSDISLFADKTKENIKLGNKIHFILEQIDFMNPVLDQVDNNLKGYVQNILDLDVIKDAINFYKEYDFVFEKENTIYRGSIDLLIEKDDSFVVIDYKLKHINDEDYFNQLKGYKEYIEGITNKKVYIYLYSIIDNKLKEVN